MEVDDSPDRQFSLEELLDESVLDIPEPPAAIGVGKDGEPRLMIKQIVNENFKSYAGTKTIGPFHKAFTSIVGPNGSGKSNVIDSMLFVFGYRAQKIRSKKVSVLIHNSEKFPNLRQATVSVHFWMITDKEGDDFEVVPDSEFVVSRTAFKDNSSHYMINGKKTNFKEVGKLLGQKGIDLVHNRFLILQGEVEQISQMKPKAENPNEEGMLEYLEDIIGSSRLKPFIEKLNHQVEQLNEHRTQRNERVKLAEEEKNKLADKFDEAKKWLNCKNNHSKNENMILQANIHNKEKTVQTTEENQAELQSQIDKVDDEIKKHKEENKEIFKAAQKAKKKRTKITTTLQTIKDKAGELESKNKICHEEKKMKKDRRKKLEKELQKAHEKVTEFTEMPQKCAEEEEALNEKLEKLKTDEKRQEENLKEAISFVERETADLRKQKEPLEKKLMELQAGVNVKQQTCDQHKTELENYTSKYDRAVASLKQINDDIEGAKTKIAEVDEEKGTLDQQIPQMESDMETKERELEKLKESRVGIQEGLANVQSKLSEAKQDGGDVRSNNKAFDYIMNHLKKKKIVNGIIGRLGDLGGINKKFDVALSSSCSMNVMVVETSQQAKEIVGKLKKDNIGSCTFYAMDKMSPFRPAPSNLPGRRLVDEIRCDDPALMKCFYKSCRDTLYADNISAARKMAHGHGQRHRVVSLDGSVIEPSGTLTGGGNRTMRGAMAETPQIKVNEQTVSDEEINRMTNEAEQYREQLRETDFNIRKLNGEVAQLKKQIEKSRQRFEIIRSEWSTASDKIKLLQGRISSAEKEVKNTAPDKKELRRLENELKDAEVEHGAAKAQAETSREEIDEINKQIGQVGKGKIEGTKKMIKKTKSEITATKKKVLKCQNDAKTAERNQKKAEDTVEALIEEEKELEARLEELKVELDKALAEFEELQSDQEEVEGHLTEATDAEKVAVAAVEKSEKEIEQLTNKIQGHKAKFSHNKDTLAELQREIKHFKHKLERLKLEPIEPTDDLTLVTLDPDQCEEVDIPALVQANQKFQTELDHHKPNLGVIREYRDRQATYLEKMKEYNVVNDARNKKREMRNELLKRRHTEFTDGFDIITNKVKQMYQMITLGGDAELELVNSLAPFDDGVIFTVRPPKKSWKNIMNLSGGEKTLSSLALVFALHHYKPTPLYVMDEIDAALDIKNVSIVAHYIKDRTKNAQFIIISLRNQMFGLASRLCGIYKTDNCTKMVVIENERDTVEEPKSQEQINTQPTTTVFTRSPMKTAVLNTSAEA